ncbi:hypothetical protein BM221_010643 [Beauveria bassiana]|uniref:Uncharacterized protein n=1 Tax=Beauveria bassiana TaxID=176275 RepID=A0A2N6N8E2_BEABA|nr:hypothetical protein BM221_010643 [Beauveria bassiana]
MEFESPEDCRAFDYYRSQSAPVLGNIMDSEFWGGLVLRLSVTEPIVRHAVLAMSSLHEYLSNNKEQQGTVGPSFVYSQYGKSISALRKWKTGDGPTIPLLACVLYTCLEFLLDNEEAARMHIMQGRKLLSSLGNDSSPAVETVKRDLVPMYTRLGLAAFLYGGNPPGVPEHFRPSITPPAKFENIAEARSVLYHLLDEGLRFSRNARPKIYTGELDADVLHTLRSAQQDLLSRTPQSKTSSRDGSRSGWHVPLNQPPTLPLEQIEEEQQLDELLDFNEMSDTVMGNGAVQGAGSLARVLDLRAEAAHLLSPYGAVESSRIKNVLIGAREKSGVTVTIFREPRTAKDHWDVRKEFIPFL